MNRQEQLEEILRRIDHRGYPAYRDTRGAYDFGSYILRIVHVQGDPFAAPSSLEIEVKAETAGFPSEMFQEKHRRTALEDFLLRRFSRAAARLSDHSGSGKSGKVTCMRCGQEVLERSACTVQADGAVTVRFSVGFPARGRTIQSRPLIRLLFQDIPEVVRETLRFASADKKKLGKVLDLADDRQFIRQQLEPMGLVAFIADGSVLARESGVSQKPMKDAVPMKSPDSLALELTLPHRGKIRGMGIRKGVTLICGGGYHGKSTFLKALEQGIYPHIEGDGRELAVTEDTAVKLRAEDGRNICSTDISMFIGSLPDGRDTTCFSTADASGSTSQAAAAAEAIEAGAHTFLIDEDTSATNFMVRDELMQRVIHRNQEPITPFIERIRQLYDSLGISTVIVAGSSGTFFHAADTVIQMDRYVPFDITRKARAAVAEERRPRIAEGPLDPPSFQRIPQPRKDLRYKGRVKIRTSGMDGFSLNHEDVDLRYLEQLVDPGQVFALGKITAYLMERRFDGKHTMREVLEAFRKELSEKGFSAFCDQIPEEAAMPRVQEIYSCLNRCRLLKMK